MTLIIGTEQETCYTISADTLLSVGDSACYAPIKLRRVTDGCVVGFAGDTGPFQATRLGIKKAPNVYTERWLYERVLVPILSACAPHQADNSKFDFSFIAATKDGLFEADCYGCVYKVREPMVATGSGSHYAYGYFDASAGPCRFLTELPIVYNLCSKRVLSVGAEYDVAYVEKRY